MMNYIDMPYFEPHHHHHHAPNPVELAQISGASQYAKLNMRLQRHIEDDDRHLRDGEREKWNKTANDFKLLKEDLGDIQTAINQKTKLSEFENDVPFLKRSDLDNLNFATIAYVDQRFNSIATPDLSSYLRISQLDTELRNKLVGYINGSPLYWELLRVLHLSR